MAAFGRLQMNFRRTGFTVNVPNNPKARLMYYLNSICTVLDIGNEPGTRINRLKYYQNYLSLSENEVNQLISICALLPPDILIDKCIFQDDAMCGNNTNQFYTITENRFFVSNSILIAGRHRSVKMIMTFKMEWLRRNYLEPIVMLKNQMALRTFLRRI
ncbi:uncharacterized protein [Argopecten irradians]|uniref:uncharacterized protein n=1 Tax=Argopecten irradians TaxID=31199 RepID=UPI003713F6E7